MTLQAELSYQTKPFRFMDSLRKLDSGWHYERAGFGGCFYYHDDKNLTIDARGSMFDTEDYYPSIWYLTHRVNNEVTYLAIGSKVSILKFLQENFDTL